MQTLDPFPRSHESEAWVLLKKKKVTSPLHKRVPHSFLQSDSRAMTHQRVSQDSIHRQWHKPRMLDVEGPTGVRCTP